MRRSVCVAVALVLAILLLCSCADSYGYRGEGLVTVHFLDVGQSDCTFIEVGGEYTVMIDASDEAHADEVCSYVRSLGYDGIDALVLTHPHSDHIGGAADVIKSFDVECVYMIDEAGEEPCYSALLGALEKHSANTVTAQRGVEIAYGGLRGEFLSPAGKQYENGNDMSAVISLRYGDVKFLFMGDAGNEVEADLLDAGADLSADLVKAGHHGSNNSSSSELIRASGASYVVFSCGIDNDYGHPSVYALDRWQSMGAQSFRTDFDSTVVACTDGEGIAIGSAGDSEYWSEALRVSPLTLPERATEQSAAEHKYVLDTAKHYVHDPRCGNAARLEENNSEPTSADMSRLIAEGYKKCRCLE